MSTERRFDGSRRDFLAKAGVGASMLATGMAIHAMPGTQAVAQAQSGHARDAVQGDFWPNGARLVISISMQFEAGGQPPKGTDSPFPKVDFPASVPSDAATDTWFA